MTTRDAILDGAFEVMRTQGLARTTTRQIAQAAGYSEATLYKLFADKVDLFLSVLTERVPRIAVVSDGVAALVGTGTVAGNLTAMATQIERFYETTFPIAMSLFSDADLLRRHRELVRSRGAGPEVIVRRVTEYLRAEQAAGRIDPDCPADASATSLVGACMHHAFLRCFDGIVDAPDSDQSRDEFAAGLTTALLHGLRPPAAPMPDDLRQSTHDDLDGTAGGPR